MRLVAIISLSIFLPAGILAQGLASSSLVPLPAQILPVTPSLNSVRNVSQGDKAKFFSVTIKVTPNESYDEDSCCRMNRERVIPEIAGYIRRTTVEGVLIQSLEGKCLTLSGAIRFHAAHDRSHLQKHLRERHVLSCFKDRPGAVQVMCTVTAPCEELRHGIYETLRQMVRRGPLGATDTSQGNGGQQRLLATSTLVLDTGL